MTDQELLKLAAKAAGHDEIRICVDELFWVITDDFNLRPWNPLLDDGDALRLAVKLEIDLFHEDDLIITDIFSEEPLQRSEYKGGDPCAATRRVIVKAAARIGEQM